MSVFREEDNLFSVLFNENQKLLNKKGPRCIRRPFYDLMQGSLFGFSAFQLILQGFQFVHFAFCSQERLL
jgi:hypothetical protein